MHPPVAGLAILGGIFAAAIGGYQLAGTDEAPFAYENSTRQQQAEYLTRESTRLEKWVHRGWVDPFNTNSSASHFRTIENTEQRQIVYQFTVTGTMAKGQEYADKKRHFLNNTCSRYMKTSLDENAIEVVREFMTQGGKSLARISISQSTCQNHI